MSDLLLVETRDGITTLTMNNSKRLNGWTDAMLTALREGIEAAGADPTCQALILTGAGDYYCAGVNLGGALKLGHPKALHAMIVEHNQRLFELFLRFPKPIFIAVNGPAIGACVTSATLCDGIIASERATFSTPFARLGVAAEGCSSVHFARIMGPANAERMLGPEGFQPTGAEAVDIGLAQWCVAPDQLLDEAHRIASEWVVEGKGRTFRGGSTLDELLAINARESVEVANSFLRRPFLKGQYKFLRSRKKWVPAAMFLGLYLTQPVWTRLP